MWTKTKRGIWVRVLLINMCILVFSACANFDDEKYTFLKDSPGSEEHSDMVYTHKDKNICGSTAKYVRTIEDKADAYYGLLCYESDGYRYYLEPDTDFISAVEKKNIEIEQGDLGEQEILMHAEIYFKSYMNKYIKGDVQSTLYEFNGVEYPVEFIEYVDGFETGTKGLILLGESGTLYAASFIKGNQYIFYPDRMLDEEHAKEIAVQYIKECKKDIQFSVKDVYSKIRTINDCTIWYFVYTIKSADKEWEENCYIYMDVYTGDVLNFSVSD